ncbi:MAG: imidazole glycerol phosphate synthase cyclase subunit, partial [Deltaproteobacteria bacterium]|nr:imidazole glycerol phosphate synthase cyclase subunit [Deltaproteobacteria bacterium]
AIDELVLLNVSRNGKSVDRFARHLETIGRYCFIPIAAGGGVRRIDDFHRLLHSGADKVVVNTAFFEDPGLIAAAARTFGSQGVVLSLDVRKDREGCYRVYSENGSRNTGEEPVSAARRAADLGAGEIFLTSIDRDGTCRGYDHELLQAVADAVGIPVIASGGVGEFQHLVDGIHCGRASAVAAANLFHFIGQSLRKAKTHLRQNGLQFPEPQWNFQRQTNL